MKKLVFDNFDDFKAREGKALPLGDWLTVTQEMITAFAEATLDFQWIHTDVDKATNLSPFKTTVAHGFMSVSLLSRMLEDCIAVKTAKMGVNYGLNKVRFPQPVPVNSRLRLRAGVRKIESYHSNGVKITWDCKVEIEGQEKPACVAEFLSLMFA